MAGVGRHDGEAACQRGVTVSCPPERRRHGAVQPATALEEKATVPLRGQRQCETDPVALAVGAGASVEGRAQAAVVGQLDLQRSQPGGFLRRRRPGGMPLGRHLGERGTGDLQLPESRARGLAPCILRFCEGHSYNHQQRKDRRSP
jgi:hypothetical protein